MIAVNVCGGPAAADGAAAASCCAGDEEALMDPVDICCGRGAAAEVPAAVFARKLLAQEKDRGDSVPPPR